ncbi:MAG: DUF5666 domain-containing protein [Gammaproteobacteria bacterium]|nr:DUF5666 domain-containing protein [Gammaproteobacteria bacterium]
MTRDIVSALVLTLATLSVVACSSGGGGGIGGSGIVAQGSITGLGSIQVNGIRFDTGAASISVDEDSAGQGDLKLGMIVTVVGRLDDDGLSAVADAVVYDDSLEGPVSAITTDEDGDTQSLSVLGDTVVADQALTVYDGPLGFDFDSIDRLDVVRISGFRDDDDRLVATRIEKTGVFNPADPGATQIEISGLITGLTDTSFSIRTFPINYDSNSTELPDGGLMEGLFVEVEGVLQSAAIAFAEEVKPEDDGLPDDADDIEIEGVVSNFVSLSNFKVSGVSVNAGSAEFEPGSLMMSIGNGSRVEVEGALRDRVLMADELKGRGGEVRIEAFVSGVNDTQKTIDLRITPTMTLTVRTDAETTTFKDELGEGTFNHGAIERDDYLRVRGFQDGAGIVASEVKRTESEDRIVVQGFVQTSSYTAPNGTITMLDKTFATDGDTEFERDGESDDDDINAADFFNDLAVMGMTAVVKLIDELTTPTLGDGIIDEVDIEDDGDSDND